MIIEAAINPLTTIGTLFSAGLGDGRLLYFGNIGLLSRVVNMSALHYIAWRYEMFMEIMQEYIGWE